MVIFVNNWLENVFSVNLLQKSWFYNNHEFYEILKYFINLFSNFQVMFNSIHICVKVATSLQKNILGFSMWGWTLYEIFFTILAFKTKCFICGSSKATSWKCDEIWLCGKKVARQCPSSGVGNHLVKCMLI